MADKATILNILRATVVDLENLARSTKRTAQKAREALIALELEPNHKEEER